MLRVSYGQVLTAEGATATFNLSAGSLEVTGGMLGGSGTVRNTNQASWTGGGLSGSFVNAAGATLTMAGSSYLDLYGTLINEGTILDTSTYNVRFIAFDGAGLVLLATAFALVVRFRRMAG